jgi:hypothetical protein
MQTKLRDMSLDLSCIKYVGRHLYVKPNYGWGWGGLDYVPAEHRKDGVPLPFHIKILQFLSWRDDVRGGIISGGVGIVDEPQHYLEDFWIVFQTRGHKGNFTNKLISYDIDLGFRDIKLRGYGMIAETPENIDYWSANWQEIEPRPDTFVDEDLRAEITKLLEEFTAT